MTNKVIDKEIIARVESLNSRQKTDVLNYLETLPKQNHSVKLHRRKALKQIQEALATCDE